MDKNIRNWSGTWISPELSELSSETGLPLDHRDSAPETDWYLMQHMGLSPELCAKDKKKAKKRAAYIPHRPCGYLRKKFTMESGEFIEKSGEGKEALYGSAVLYATAHGLFEVYLNGVKVSGEVLSPGVENYNQRMPVRSLLLPETALRSGENELLVMLGDGWYRGCDGLKGNRNVYGKDLSFYAELEVNGNVVLTTNDTWEGSTSGPIRMSDTEQGELYDASREEISDWHEVREFSREDAPEFYKNLWLSDSLPIMKHEVFQGQKITTENGETVFDFSQNLAGGISFSLTAHEGDQIVIECGETLDKDGNFTNANFQPGMRHSEDAILQRIVYRCKEGENSYESRFCIFGFRYARVSYYAAKAIEGNYEGKGQQGFFGGKVGLVQTDLPEDAKFSSFAIYSDMEETATFSCSDERLNRLFQNCLWSMKGNFCDIPTDCPTRERSGWTGDVGVFINTGLRLMNSAPVFKKWLRCVADQQHKDGKVANICPGQGKESIFPTLLAGSVGWGDTCILAPFAIYEYTGEVEILRENYGTMKRWMSYLESRAKKRPLRRKFSLDALENYHIDTGVDYGEWCEPGKQLYGMMAGKSSIPTAYLAHSAALMAEIAKVLAEDARTFVMPDGMYEKDVAYYKALADDTRAAFRKYHTNHGRIESDRQCEYVRAIAFDLLSEEEKEQAAADLNSLVIKNGYHLNTGFLSTPYLLPVLCQYGYEETAGKLLMQNTIPSWLYEVEKGATTVWERWEGINEEGEVRDSLNHYSYGAVAGWMLSGLCGISYTKGKVLLQPHFIPGLDFAEASLMTPDGEVALQWQKMKNNTYEVNVKVPANLEVTYNLPESAVLKA